MPTTFADVACPVCGCVCDDLTVTTDGGRVTAAAGACRLAEPWFLAQTAGTGGAAEIDGSPAPLAAAIARAAEILRAARSPLIYGLSRSGTDAHRAAAALADRLGATLDTADGGHSATVAFQQVGESTCTLGEVKQRADLVIFWGADPVVTHPRFLERYAPERAGRVVVVVDEVETATAKVADLFVRVEPGRHWDALWALRLLVSGVETDSVFRPLADRMTACRFGVVFFGDGLTRGTVPHRTAEALFQLVTDLNARTRFYARRMRAGDVGGAESVLTWQTGYPFGVNFGRGYPRYNPGEFTAPDLLARGEVDACVLVGAPAGDLSPAAVAHLRTIPVIALDPPGEVPVVPAAVRFTTAVYGVHRPGTASRLDDVAIPLRVLLPGDAPSDGDVLAGILRAVGG